MVHDLYILMITAGIVSLLFKLLKQPVVLGYIVAGVLVGPYVFGGSWVNAENVEAWGNIGVLFVLFCIGLVFRIKNLISSGKVAQAEQQTEQSGNTPSMADKARHAVRHTIITKQVVNLFIKNMSENDEHKE